jgi:hypothetical protein
MVLATDHDESPWPVLSQHSLAALSAELQALVRHWIDTVPDDETIMYYIEHRQFRVPLLIDLLDRVDHLRAAIRIAELTGGYLYI